MAFWIKTVEGKLVDVSQYPLLVINKSRNNDVLIKCEICAESPDGEFIVICETSDVASAQSTLSKIGDCLNARSYEEFLPK